MNGATLFRRNGPAWRFETDASTCGLCHRTRAGTLYRIYAYEGTLPAIKVLRCDRGDWVDQSGRLGAEHIQFDDGGEYWFKGKQR